MPEGVDSFDALGARRWRDLCDAWRTLVTRTRHLAAAKRGKLTVVATADSRLLAAAQRRRFAVSNPLEPRATPEATSEGGA